MIHFTSETGKHFLHYLPMLIYKDGHYFHRTTQHCSGLRQSVSPVLLPVHCNTCTQQQYVSPSEHSGSTTWMKAVFNKALTIFTFLKHLVLVLAGIDIIFFNIFLDFQYTTWGLARHQSSGVEQLWWPSLISLGFYSLLSHLFSIKNSNIIIRNNK